MYQKCIGINKNGTPCRHNTVADTKYCRQHFPLKLISRKSKKTINLPNTVFWFVVGAIGEVTISDLFDFVKDSMGYEFLIPPIKSTEQQHPSMPPTPVPEFTPTPNQSPTPFNTPKLTPTPREMDNPSDLDYVHDGLTPISITSAKTILEQDNINDLLGLNSSLDLIIPQGGLSSRGALQTNKEQPPRELILHLVNEKLGEHGAESLVDIDLDDLDIDFSHVDNFYKIEIDISDIKIRVGDDLIDFSQILQTNHLHFEIPSLDTNLNFQNLLDSSIHGIDFLHLGSHDTDLS